MQITDSDFTRPLDEYSSYFGRPYDHTTANMDPWQQRNNPAELLQFNYAIS